MRRCPTCGPSVVGRRRVTMTSAAMVKRGCRRRLLSPLTSSMQRTTGLLAILAVWVSAVSRSRWHRTSPPAPSFVVPNFSLQRRPSVFGCRPHAAPQVTNKDDAEIGSPPPAYFDDELGGGQTPLSQSDLEDLTVSQLKQQLRLRGMKVSGRKGELIKRLLGGGDVAPFVGGTDDTGSGDKEVLEPELVGKNAGMGRKKSKARIFSEDRGKELIDVTAYLDEDDKNRATRSSEQKRDPTDAASDDQGKEDTGPETWGDQAKIVDDYEGRSVIVDGLSRTVVEYVGSNFTKVQAYVVASRDALKAYLSGGQDGKNETSSAETRLREIQTRREKESKVPVKFEDDEGLEGGDPKGYYDNVVERDYSDWGKFTQTGAQISAEEVQGVLLLSDVYGAFTDDTRALAEKIAFECQPVVVMVPDLFRGNPWKEPPVGVEKTKRDQLYEDWRSSHPDLRVNVDVRAAAACLKRRYGVSEVAVWGTCYGGGRALEAAAGFVPEGGTIHDVDGRVGPPPVNPSAVVAWYPTRWSPTLFGSNREKGNALGNGQEGKKQMAVMAIFAGSDNLPGATPADAALLQDKLESDDRVKDHMVKVFPDQGHGFAHKGLGTSLGEDGVGMGDPTERFVDEEFGGAGRVTMDNSDSEVACLLSTAWMETYTRVFLPTTGPAVKDDENESWSKDISMKDLSFANGRDVRKEIEEQLESHVDMKLGNMKYDPYTPVSAEEAEKIFEPMAKMLENNPNVIDPDDDFVTVYEKLKHIDSEGELEDVAEFLRMDKPPLDDTEEAYW